MSTIQPLYGSSPTPISPDLILPRRPRFGSPANDLRISGLMLVVGSLAHQSQLYFGWHGYFWGALFPLGKLFFFWGCYRIARMHDLSGTRRAIYLIMPVLLLELLFRAGWVVGFFGWFGAVGRLLLYLGLLQVNRYYGSSVTMLLLITICGRFIGHFFIDSPVLLNTVLEAVFVVAGVSLTYRAADLV